MSLREQRKSLKLLDIKNQETLRNSQIRVTNVLLSQSVSEVRLTKSKNLDEFEDDAMTEYENDDPEFELRNSGR